MRRRSPQSVPLNPQDLTPPEDKVGRRAHFAAPPPTNAGVSALSPSSAAHAPGGAASLPVKLLPGPREAHRSRESSPHATPQIQAATAPPPASRPKLRRTRQTQRAWHATPRPYESISDFSAAVYPWLYSGVTMTKASACSHLSLIESRYPRPPPVPQDRSTIYGNPSACANPRPRPTAPPCRKTAPAARPVNHPNLDLRSFPPLGHFALSVPGYQRA